MEVVEIIDRAEQGVTQPYLCRAEDDCLFYVKGANLPRRELVAEFVAAELARAWGLNLPKFQILEIRRDVAQRALEAGLGDPGTGPVFGSEVEINTLELSFSDIHHIPAELKSDIAFFDFWIGNTDRTLSVLGGNPNMLIRLETNEVLIFDHNQSFDFLQSLDEFSEQHVFGEALLHGMGDENVRSKYQRRNEHALRDWQRIEQLVPDEWFFLDHQQTVDADFSMGDFFDWLVRDQGIDGVI